MDVVLAFSERAIEEAIDRLAQAEEIRTCQPAASYRQQMRDAVKMVCERGYRLADAFQQDLALAVFLLAATDDITMSPVN